jgi:putative acetyltransferase
MRATRPPAPREPPARVPNAACVDHGRNGLRSSTPSRCRVLCWEPNDLGRGCGAHHTPDVLPPASAGGAAGTAVCNALDYTLCVMPMPLDDPRFTPARSGRFRERYGLVGRGGAHSSKKLCLAATDAGFLIDLLYGLSLREDCFYVKYGTVARDGMYLGRCFLASDEAASELCYELKGHPRLLVSLQDDAWFAKFREAKVPSNSFGVWDELPEDEPQVTAALESAFGRSDEARMVAALRAANAATISLVAQTPPEDRERSPWPTVGHIALSPVTIDGSSEPRGLGLGPLAVAPMHQRSGVGTKLVRAALRRARLLGYSYVVVLGHPHYYPRFGFEPASRFGLSYLKPIPDPVFMALELAAGALVNVAGVVRYHPAFSG